MPPNMENSGGGDKSIFDDDVLEGAPPTDGDEGIPPEDEEEGTTSEEDDDDESEESDDEEESSGEEDAEDGMQEEEDALDESEGESGSDSDSGENQCAICLRSYRGLDIGVPGGCDHAFHLDCIQEWAKNVTTCPKDRIFFGCILVKNCPEGEVIRSIKVEQKVTTETSAEEDPTFCEMCGRSDHEDRLLLCDECDLGYHCECLDPPLQDIPIEEWYCPTCAPAHAQESAESSSDEDAYFQNLRRAGGGRRSIPRTGLTERIRQRVSEARIARQEPALDAASTSATPHPRAAACSKTAKTPAAKKPARRRKRKTKARRKRKTTKRKTATKTGETTRRKTTTKKKTRRKRRRKKRKRAKRGVRTAKSLLPTTAKGRLAGKLGLCKPRVGCMLPSSRAPGSHESSLGALRSRIGLAPLSLRGDQFALDDITGDSTGSVAIPRVSSILRGPRLMKPVEPAAASPVDLLSSILAGQDRLHMPVSDIKIHQDGSLTVIKPSPDSCDLVSSSGDVLNSRGAIPKKMPENQLKWNRAKVRETPLHGENSGASPDNGGHGGNSGQYGQEGMPSDDTSPAGVEHQEMPANQGGSHGGDAGGYDGYTNWGEDDRTGVFADSTRSDDLSPGKKKGKETSRRRRASEDGGREHPGREQSRRDIEEEGRVGSSSERYDEEGNSDNLELFKLCSETKARNYRRGNKPGSHRNKPGGHGSREGHHHRARRRSETGASMNALETAGQRGGFDSPNDYLDSESPVVQAEAKPPHSESREEHYRNFMKQLNNPDGDSSPYGDFVQRENSQALTESPLAASPLTGSSYDRSALEKSAEYPQGNLGLAVPETFPLRELPGDEEGLRTPEGQFSEGEETESRLVLKNDSLPEEDSGFWNRPSGTVSALFKNSDKLCDFLGFDKEVKTENHGSTSSDMPTNDVLPKGSAGVDSRDEHLREVISEREEKGEQVEELDDVEDDSGGRQNATVSSSSVVNPEAGEPSDQEEGLLHDEEGAVSSDEEDYQPQNGEYPEEQGSKGGSRGKSVHMGRRKRDNDGSDDGAVSSDEESHPQDGKNSWDQGSKEVSEGQSVCMAKRTVADKSRDIDGSDDGAVSSDEEGHYPQNEKNSRDRGSKEVGGRQSVHRAKCPKTMVADESRGIDVSDDGAVSSDNEGYPPQNGEYSQEQGSKEGRGEQIVRRAGSPGEINADRLGAIEGSDDGAVTSEDDADIPNPEAEGGIGDDLVTGGKNPEDGQISEGDGEIIDEVLEEGEQVSFEEPRDQNGRKKRSSRRSSGKRRHEDSEEEGELKSDGEGRVSSRSKKRSRKDSRKSRRRVIIEKDKTVSLQSREDGEEGIGGEASKEREGGDQDKLDLRQVIRVKRDSPPPMESPAMPGSPGEFESPPPRIGSPRFEEDFSDEDEEERRVRHQREWDDFRFYGESRQLDFDYDAFHEEWERMDYYQKEIYWENFRATYDQGFEHDDRFFLPEDMPRRPDEILAPAETRFGRKETVRERLRRERLELEAAKNRDNQMRGDSEPWMDVDRGIELRRLKFKAEIEREERVQQKLREQEERENQRLKELEEQKEKQRQKEKEKQEKREREKERERERVRERERKEREREEQREREKEQERERKREKEREVERKREKEREKKKYKERGRDRGSRDDRKRNQDRAEQERVHSDRERKRDRGDRGRERDRDHSRDDRERSRDRQERDSDREERSRERDRSRGKRHNKSRSQSSSSRHRSSSQKSRRDEKKGRGREDRQEDRRSDRRDSSRSDRRSTSSSAQRSISVQRKEKPPVKDTKSRKTKAAADPKSSHEKVETIVLDTDSEDESSRKTLSENKDPVLAEPASKPAPVETAEKTKKKKKLKVGRVEKGVKGKKGKKTKGKVGKEKKKKVAKRPLSFDVAEIEPEVASKKRKGKKVTTIEEALPDRLMAEIPDLSPSLAQVMVGERDEDRGFLVSGDYHSPVKSPESSPAPEETAETTPPLADIPAPASPEPQPQEALDSDALYDPFEPTASPPLAPSSTTPDGEVAPVQEKSMEEAEKEPQAVETVAEDVVQVIEENDAAEENDDDEKVIEVLPSSPPAEQKRARSPGYKFTNASDYSDSPSQHGDFSDVEGELTIVVPSPPAPNVESPTPAPIQEVSPPTQKESEWPVSQAPESPAPESEVPESPVLEVPVPESPAHESPVAKSPPAAVPESPSPVPESPSPVPESPSPVPESPSPVSPASPPKKGETSVTSSNIGSSSRKKLDKEFGDKAMPDAATSEATKTITQLLKKFTKGSSSAGSSRTPMKKSLTTSVADSTQSVSSSGSVDLSLFSADGDEEDMVKQLAEDDIESSAVDLYNKNSREKYLKKLYHQERVVEEVKLALKPFYQKKEVTKDEFKEIMRKSVNQVSHSKSGEINPVRIRSLVEGYVKKFQYLRRHPKKKSSSLSVKTLVNKGKGIGLK